MKHTGFYGLSLLFLVLLALSWLQPPLEITEARDHNDYFQQRTAQPGTPTPTMTPLCLRNGDVNLSGTLTAEDSQLCFQYILGFVELDSFQLCAADCNNNGSISASDSQQIFLAVLSLGNCAEALPSY